MCKRRRWIRYGNYDVNLFSSFSVFQARHMFVLEKGRTMKEGAAGRDDGVVGEGIKINLMIMVLLMTMKTVI